MKTFTIIVLFAFTSNIFWAQDITFLDSFHYSEYLDDNWELLNGIVYDQLADGSVKSTTFEMAFGERFITAESSSIFDSNGNIVESVSKTYDPSTSSFYNSSRTLQDFDENNNLLLRLGQEWNNESDDWEESYKSEYSLYDSYNNYALWKNYDYTQNGDWEIASTIRVDNFYENSLLDSCFRIRNGNPWFSVAYDYVGNNLLIEDRTVFYFFDVADFFIKVSYEYNDQDLLGYRYGWSYSLTAGETEYSPSFRQEYSYTNSGHLAERISERYDAEEEEFFLDWKRSYFYPQSTAVENVTLSTINVQWSNSMINQIEINISELEASKKYRLSIFDAAGRLVKNLSLQNSNQWSQRYSLQSGVYHLIIQDESGARHTEKIVIN